MISLGSVINYKNLAKWAAAKLYKFTTGRRDGKTGEKAVLERVICMQLQWQTVSSTHGTSSEACHVRQLALLSVSLSLQNTSHSAPLCIKKPFQGP